MRKAAIWIGIYLALVSAPLVLLLWDLSMALGFAGMAMMASSSR
jgi:hypothetical protein